MSDKEILNQYFGANVYPAHIVEAYDFKSVHSSNEEKTKSIIKDWKAAGYTVKRKANSMGTYIAGVKKKEIQFLASSLPQKIEITVSADNFAKGVFKDAEGCPLCLAFWNMFPKADAIVVYPYSVGVKCGDTRVWFTFDGEDDNSVLIARAGKDNQDPYTMSLTRSLN